MHAGSVGWIALVGSTGQRKVMTFSVLGPRHILFLLYLLWIFVVLQVVNSFDLAETLVLCNVDGCLFIVCEVGPRSPSHRLVTELENERRLTVTSACLKMICVSLHQSSQHCCQLSWMSIIRSTWVDLIRWVRCPYVRPSKKSFSDSDEIWYVGRCLWVMHDCMPYDLIQGQGHETFKVRNSSIFKIYLLRHF